jgi:hypothetical protein
MGSLESSLVNNVAPVRERRETEKHRTEVTQNFGLQSCGEHHGTG